MVWLICMPNVVPLIELLEFFS
uniref:Uncharacterized protein n=1 Tax=Arundo donax TaxID=35708 RepID=A0A0A8ZQG0_ARUDO